MEKEPEFHMFHMIKQEDGKEPFKAHIDRYGDVHISDDNRAMEYKLNVVKRMCGNGYKYDWQDPFLVLLGTIAELEDEVRYWREDYRHLEYQTLLCKVENNDC